jgi:hypothetical protein
MKRLKTLNNRGCCRCPFRAPSGRCLDPAIKSGRCGDWVWYLWRNQQRRHVYFKPADPATSKQRRWRARFRAASRKYSKLLTDEQQDACIAAGAKLPCRPRLGPSGYLTGQQYLIRKEYAAKEEPRLRRAKLTAEVPQLQIVTETPKSQALQPQRLTRSTSGTRRGLSGTSPGGRCRNTGRAGEDKGRRKSEECRKQKVKAASEVQRPQRVMRPTRGRNRSTPRAMRWHVASNSDIFPLSGKASAFASPSISRPLASQGSRGRSPSLRRYPWRGRAGRVEAVWRWRQRAVGRRRGLPERNVLPRETVRRPRHYRGTGQKHLRSRHYRGTGQKHLR